MTAAVDPFAATVPGGDAGMAGQYVTTAHMHGTELAIRRWRGDFYVYERGIYRPISEDTLDGRIMRVLKIEDRRTARNVRDALVAVPTLGIDEVDPPALIGGDLDPLQMIACPNGLVDLVTGEVLPPTPRFFALSGLGVNYDPGAPEPALWLRSLDQWFAGDPEQIAALQEWFGLLLVPDTSHEKILLLVGPTRSGKGSAANTLTHLLGGKQSVAAPTLSSLASNFGCMPLIGKLVAIVGDARLSPKTDLEQTTERLLTISGGDALTIDRKNRDHWTGRLSARFVILTNVIPRFTDASGVIAKRFIALETRQSFLGCEDKTLKCRLLEELPGILNWSIAGWRRLRAQQCLTQPASSRHLVQALDDLASPVGAFLRECCRLSPGAFAFKAITYQRFERWAREHGIKQPPTEAVFARDLYAAAGGAVTDTKRPNAEGTRKPVYLGLELVADQPAAVEIGGVL